MPAVEIDDLPIAISPRKLQELIPDLGRDAAYVVARALGIRVRKKLLIPRERFIGWLRGELKITPTSSVEQKKSRTPATIEPAKASPGA